MDKRFSDAVFTALGVLASLAWNSTKHWQKHQVWNVQEDILRWVTKLAMQLPFLKTCSRSAWFRLDDLVDAERRTPGLAGDIEAALSKAGGQPGGVNMPQGLVWVCMDESKLSVEQVSDLFKSFGLTVYYLGENYDRTPR